MPEGVTDRPADVGEPLLAIADAVGGTWPERARAACITLVTASRANDKGSVGVRLLTDLRDHVMTGIDRLPTVAILDRLNSMDDAPWADLNGKPLDIRRLSKMLAEYMTADNEPIAFRNIKAGLAALLPPTPRKSATSATRHRKPGLTCINPVAASPGACRYPSATATPSATSDRPSDLHGSGGSGSSGLLRGAPRPDTPKESSPWPAPRCSSSPKSSPRSA